MSEYYVNNERKVYTKEEFNMYTKDWDRSYVVQTSVYFEQEPVLGMEESFFRPTAVFAICNYMVGPILSFPVAAQYYLYNRFTSKIITICEWEKIFLSEYTNFIRGGLESTYYGTVEQERELMRLCQELELPCHEDDRDRFMCIIPEDEMPTGIDLLDQTINRVLHN